MLDKIKSISEEIKAAEANSHEELEAFRIRYISRKSVVGELFLELKDVALENRRTIGQALNELKDAAQDKFKELITLLEEKAVDHSTDHIDLTLPPSYSLGARHPLSVTRARIIEIFQRIGFNISEGPEIEDDWHNFGALNFPEDHPAREMQDTFFIYKSDKKNRW